MLKNKAWLLQVSYSSADGSDHYRELVKKVKLALAPSAYVTQWDVMPSETLNKSYLVLDIENRTENEMEITYDPAKSLSIEPGDECRIPLPVNCFEITGKTIFHIDLVSEPHFGTTYSCVASQTLE